MEKFINYLLEEEARLARKATTQARKEGKKERVKKMLDNMQASQPKTMSAAAGR